MTISDEAEIGLHILSAKNYNVSNLPQKIPLPCLTGERKPMKVTNCMQNQLL